MSAPLSPDDRRALANVAMGGPTVDAQAPADPIQAASAAFDAAFSAAVTDPGTALAGQSGFRRLSPNERHARNRAAIEEQPQEQPAPRKRRLSEFTDDEIKRLSERVFQEEMRRNLLSDVPTSDSGDEEQYVPTGYYDGDQE